MKESADLSLTVDESGRILAARLTRENDNEDGLVTELAANRGQQQVVHLEVPLELLELPGPSLERFLSELKIRRRVEAEVPEFEISRIEHD